MAEEQKPALVVIGTGAANARFLSGPNATTKVTDPITATPVIQGQHGRAWLCDSENGRRKMNLQPGQDAGLVHWVVEAPWAHPAWHSYSIILIHLRPMEGHKQPVIYLQGATHEILVHVLNPKRDRNKLLADGMIHGDTILTPTNFAGQIIEIEDRYALDRVSKAIKMICDGTLSPDTDHIDAWGILFGRHMMKR